MIKLTKRQSDVLETIREFINETGFPPTRAEIAARLGFRSPNAAEEHLKALSKKRRNRNAFWRFSWHSPCRARSTC